MVVEGFMFLIQASISFFWDLSVVMRSCVCSCASTIALIFSLIVSFLCLAGAGDFCSFLVLSVLNFCRGMGAV